MASDVESRLAYLETVVDAQVKLNSILFPLIIKHDEQLSAKVAECLRQFQVSQATPNLSPFLSNQITVLRNLLVLPVPQEVVEASRQQAIRLVDPLK